MIDFPLADLHVHLKGGLTLDKFVELNGNELTLAQLATRHSDAFLRAGLDPAKFK